MSKEQIDILGPRRLHNADFKSLEHRGKRGLETELRFQNILGEMVKERTFTKIEKATQNQDRRGIDFFGYIIVKGEIIRVPLQVKSSISNAIKYNERNINDIRRKGIIVVVVNENRTDQEVKSYVRKRLKKLKRKPAGMAEVVNALV